MPESLFNFLFSTVMTLALVGIPTLVHWVWRGRNRPLLASYYWTLAQLLVWFGTIYAGVATLFVVLILVDLSGVGLAYPAWSLLFCAGLTVIGLIIRRAGKLWLAHQRRTPA